MKLPRLGRMTVDSGGDTKDDITDNGDWMSELPADTALVTVSIPGSHDSFTYSLVK